MKQVFAAVMMIAIFSGVSMADITASNSATENGYTDHIIDFEDAPTGVNMDPFNTYQASDGVTFASGNGFLVASNWDDTDGIDGGASPGGIQLASGFGMSMLFDEDIQELSWQGWAPGSPNPPLGGMSIIAFNDGVEVFAAFGAFSAPFGGAGNEWFNLEATDGMSFDEVRFFNGAFNSFNTFIDNVSFNNAAVPEPTSLGILAIAGLAVMRRKR